MPMINRLRRIEWVILCACYSNSFFDFAAKKSEYRIANQWAQNENTRKRREKEDQKNEKEIYTFIVLQKSACSVMIISCIYSWFFNSIPCQIGTIAILSHTHSHLFDCSVPNAHTHAFLPISCVVNSMVFILHSSLVPKNQKILIKIFQYLLMLSVLILVNISNESQTQEKNRNHTTIIGRKKNTAYCCAQIRFLTLLLRSYDNSRYFGWSSMWFIWCYRNNQEHEKLKLLCAVL